MEILDPNDARLGMFYSTCCELDVREIQDDEELTFVQISLEGWQRFPLEQIFDRDEWVGNQINLRMGKDEYSYWVCEVSGFTGCWTTKEEAVEGSD